MKLEDLLLKRFRVEKMEGRMIAFPDENGKYKAVSAEEVEDALSTNKYTQVQVLVGTKWFPIRKAPQTYRY